MTEIGGYFGLEQFNGVEYYSDLIAVNNGRSALLYILKSKNIKKLYIPFFLCDSVSQMCEREGYEYEYYNVKSDFMPSFDKSLKKNEYLYVVNYYGQISNDMIKQLKNQYENIIIDNVQAFFQNPVDNIDTIYSCRKFFGVPDGGYVSTNTVLDEEIIQDVSMDRMRHVLGRYEGKSASDYYCDFKKSDALYKEIELRTMSKLTHNLLRGIDYEYVRNKREENFRYLDSKLKKINKLSLTMPIGPYAYPLYVENGMEIKKKLAEKKIFVATLWPNVLHGEEILEKKYAENILPLPVDQRYDLNDMKKMLEELFNCL